MRVLITAGAGFLGREVSKILLDRGDEVTILDTRLDSNLRGAEFVSGRAHDFDLLSDLSHQVDAMIHLEWSGSVQYSMQYPVEAQNRNLGVIWKLIELAKDRSLPVVFTSTSAVYGGETLHPTPETETPDPKSFYAAQKLYAEGCLRVAARSFELDITILRAFNLYGIGAFKTAQIVPRLLDCCFNGEPIRLTGDGLQTRDFIHVADAARGCVLALDARLEPGRVVNLCSGQGTTMLHLAQMIREVSGRDVPIEFTPPRAGESRYLVGDASRARDDFGFVAERTVAESVSEIWEAKLNSATK